MNARRCITRAHVISLRQCWLLRVTALSGTGSSAAADRAVSFIFRTSDLHDGARGITANALCPLLYWVALNGHHDRLCCLQPFDV